MSKVTATQADPSKPSPEDWRPTPIRDESKAKADFLAGWNDKPGKSESAKPANDDDLDEEASTDEGDEEEESDDVEIPSDDSEEDDSDEKDTDSDLDEDDNQDSDEKPVADPVAAKTMAKLQQKEQRMRQQFDRERDSLRSELASARETMRESITREVKAEAARERDLLIARAKSDPIGFLSDHGFEDHEYLSQQAYLRGKGKDDPKFKDAATRLQADRALREEVADVKKKLADREKSESETRAEATQRQAVDALLDGIAKSAPKIEKAKLTQLALKNDPAYAKAVFAQATFDLWQRDGREPKPRDVVIAAEKIQRAHLRRYGIDPGTLTKASDDKSANTNGKAINGKSAKKPGKTNGKPAEDDELTRPTKEQLLSEDWTR